MRKYNSIGAHEEEEIKNSTGTFEEPFTALSEFHVGDFWIKVITKNQAFFLNFVPQDAPVVRCTVKVSVDLSLKLLFGETELEKRGTFVLPVMVSDL